VYLSASALTDIFYICRRQAGIDRARHAVEACLQGFSIIGVDRRILVAALALGGNDFEDNVQIVCAQTAGLDAIVTRNTGDFAHAQIRVADPPALIAQLGQPSP
jgi:predicted nucleic acid-binding protein